MTLPASDQAPRDVNVILADSPYLSDSGVRGLYLGEKGAEFELTPAPRHRNAESGLNGGVIASLLDAVCGRRGAMSCAPMAASWAGAGLSTFAVVR